MLRLRSLFIASFILVVVSVQAFADVRFAHITDLHIFEDKKRDSEAKVSAMDFDISVEKINKISQQLKAQSKDPLAFVLLSGDIGVGKLLKIDPSSGKLDKDSEKWTQALESISKILKDSHVKQWLFVPGNNDLFEERHDSVTLYSDFLKELQDRPEINKAGLSIVDFRLEASQRAQKGSPPGQLVLKDLLFVGWDNSYFKNNNSIKNYIDKDNHVIPDTKTLEYQSIEQLGDSLEKSTAKYAYIFYHIPEIDDPYLIRFDESKADNVVSKRMAEAKKVSPIFAQGLYSYSAWTVPLGVRTAWEKLITQKSKGPVIKGLFAGHFHDHKKETYLSTLLIKTKKYKDEILKKLYIAPPVSVKNQTQYPVTDRARGGQIIIINDHGNVTRELFWFD
jgi:hypothetical protein